MALTNLNALGSAIRTKVGEAEKKTLPQLKDIIDNQLVYPQSELSVTTNGNYDVKSYASVNVETDERTEEDDKNAEIASVWNDLFVGETGQFSLGSIKTYTGRVPLIDAHNATSFYGAFQYGKATEYIVDIGNKATSAFWMFQNCPNLVKVELIGSTRNITTFEEMFYQTPKIEEIKGVLDLTSATNTLYMFGASTALREVRFEPYSIHISIQHLFYQSKLSVDSVLSVLNGLADLSGLDSKTQDFSGSLNYDSTDDNVKQAIADAVAKNWIVTMGGHTYQEG